MILQGFRISLFYILLFLCTNTALAQSGRFYSPDNDLSSSLINQVYQDSKGFIWVATENGLNKFDGIKFAAYKHLSGDSTSIKSNYVRTIFEDRNNLLWIGCLNGLMKYNRATDSFQEIKMYRDGEIISPHVTSIIEAKNGDIWIATSGQGIFTIRKNEEIPHAETKLNASLVSNFLTVVYEDNKGNLWIGSENSGLNCYLPQSGEIETFKSPTRISGNNISSIVEDKDGVLFAGTLIGGLNRYNPEKKQFEPVSYNNNSSLAVKSLVVNNQNTLYIGTDGAGLKVYNRENHKIEDFQTNYVPIDLSRGKVHSVLQDSDNNIWLGCFQKGIVFISGIEKKFDYYGPKSLACNPIGTGCVMSIYKDRDGILWVGADNEGLYGIDGKGNRVAHFKPGNSASSISGTILSIFEDSDGNLWIGSFTKGLAKINKKTGQCIYISQLQNEKVYSITEDNRKNLLIGTYGSGFFQMNLQSGEIRHFESQKRENDILSEDELSNDWINSILVDSEGLIWIAHYKGVSCYNPDKNTFINYLDQNNILPGTVGYTLSEDRKGKIWIGTTEGLYVFDKKDSSIKVFKENDGLPNDVICGISEDNEGNMWVSTYLGMSKFVLSENRFINYYAGDGLQGNEFTRGAKYEDTEGKIYFGGINGITSFYPKDITETKKELKILITNFYLFNHAVKLGDLSGGRKIVSTAISDADEFTLAYNDNTFVIEFSTLDFSNPERIVYQYMIEELSSAWINSFPGINRVTYTNLAPGTYTFKVRAVDHDNYSAVKIIRIIITPPWYQTLWAYCMYAVLSMLLIYFAANFIHSKVSHRRSEVRRKHQIEINEAKLQFFINISHEIRTPMTLIISPLEKLIANTEDSGKLKIYLMMYRNSQRILRLINQLMDIRKLDKGQMFLKCRETDMVGFIKDLMLTFEYSAQQKNITFDFLHKDEELKVWIDLNNFDKILLNILSNAFKYTPDNGNITVELTTGRDEHQKGPLRHYFEVTVTDSGIGIDKSKVNKIFERFYQINNDVTSSNFGTGIGLHLAKSLVELHRGHIFAENRPDTQGSRFVIRVPLGNAHLKTSDLEESDYADTEVVTVSSGKSLEVATYEQIDEDITDKKEKIKPRSRYRILIVEDEDEIRQYIREELSDEYKISECVNGKEALERILSEMPDLIVSDVMMPEMDGITLCKKVKQNININHIPVILLTAKSNTEHKVEGLDIGADAYIVKPFNTSLLRSTIRNLVSNRERLKNKYSGLQIPESKLDDLQLRSPDEILMDKIVRIVNANLSNSELSVEMLASEVGMSRVHLHRKLKELTSLPARDFIKGIRLKQAASLLTGKKLTISEVAYATGFSSLSHFSNSFREFYGLSPKEYMTDNLPKEE
ncbi:hybrid sensor histidine kinase/response regulator transcription factor [Dysgonomonas macrotermitis]|uniref:histidine kinase n=1 Tax=Dysgonomonas macrotermitis TaxID=1346286 RepID=A0A1M4SLB0_9BACT|nr:two-component regulator propeller domain-containing protein [Dysgonomonas macrotermitis]SHE33033.1 Signal transduction histidine kinase [Dysgonomonas macrotermitis]